MRYIRSPAWDFFWIWSGVPVGLLLAATVWSFWTPAFGFRGTIAEQPLYWFFALVVLLETGHVLSSAVLVWSHRGLRQLAWRRRGRFVWLALAAFGVAFSVGVVTSLGWTTFKPGLHQIFHVTDWTNPLPIMVWLYLALNAYHFGMQNFGVLQLYKRRNDILGWRRVEMGAVVLLTVAAICGLQRGDTAMAFLGIGAISLNHWMVEIGLCGRVSGKPWLFTAVILGLGAVGFAWLIPTSQGNMMVVMPAVMGARLGMSFVHFLYDRWIWKFSDPAIRDVVGGSLFA